ncbi:MAG: type II toxin-antitoxin system RelE/ParE family toxin [Thauera sp.]|nr:type II toxin-antitoxin system RelE/ParE family toxin [Thauera sp.]
MAEFQLSPAAVLDLEDIWRYTARRWSAAQAERYLDLLDAAFEQLAREPLSAPACEHIRKGYRRWRVERHWVYFRIDQGVTVVMRVLHERMDTGRHL